MKPLRQIVPCLVLLAGQPGFAADIPSIPASGRLDLEILRDGSKIGTHSVRFERDAEGLTVRVRVDVAVKIAFVTVYRISEVKRETWRNGVLVAYQHDGIDDGEIERVRAHADGPNLVVTQPAARPSMPLGGMASTYWNATTVKQKVLLDSSTGAVVPIQVAAKTTEMLDLGRGEEPVTAYRITGELARTLLYDRKGVWAGMRLTASDGSRIEYRRR